MSRILLEADGIEVRFGDRTLLKIERLRVYDGERIGLIGENGAGKSTLLKVLAGELVPDAGAVRRACPVALIRQTGDAGDDISKGLRSAFRAPVQREGLSGGELTRRRIAAALTRDAPLLLADEPTTDLDSEGIAALREAIAHRRGAMILVSHDRALLRKLCDRIWRLEDGKIDDFPGGYDACQAELQRRREYQQFKYDRSRAEQARLKAAAQRQTEWAASVKKVPKRMGNSEARLHTREYTNAVLALSHAKRTLENRMERVERVERPRDLPEVRMALGASRPIAAKIALRLERASLSAGGKALLSNAALTLPTGSRTALIGENGCGKTTLLRAIAGECPPGVAFSGKLSINPGARIGRFDQDHAKSLDLHRTALENAVADTVLPESEVRTVLARLGLRGDDVFKTADWLSGGERARVALAKLLVGWLHDRIRLRRTLTLCCVSAVASILLLLSVRPEGRWTAVIYGPMMSLALPMETIILPLLAADLFGDREFEKLLGIFVSVSTAGFAVGVPLSNLCHDLLGSYRPALMATACVMAGVTAAYQFILRASDRKRATMEIGSRQ